MSNPTEREVRMSVGECPDHPDHDTHWVDDDQGYCRNCGAEFIDEDDSPASSGEAEGAAR